MDLEACRVKRSNGKRIDRLDADVIVQVSGHHPVVVAQYGIRWDAARVVNERKIVQVSHHKIIEVGTKLEVGKFQIRRDLKNPGSGIIPDGTVIP